MSNCPNNPSSPATSDENPTDRSEQKTPTPLPEQSDHSTWTEAQRPEYTPDRYDLFISFPIPFSLTSFVQC